MRSTIGIEVAAPAELVFRLARDIERWPHLLPHYVRVRLLAGPDPDGVRRLEMLARRQLPGPFGLVGLSLPLVWRSRVWSDPARLRLRFVHEGGASDGMDVTWRIEPLPVGCRVTIEHVFERRPSFVPRLLDRLITRPVAGRTLATFKSIAEALAEPGPATAPGATGESTPSRPTKGRT